MVNLRKRWELIRSYIGWEDYLGGAILLLGFLGLINGPIPHIPGLTNAYQRISPELIGIGITVLIIDNANEAIKRREEKKRLILQMGSPDNTFAVEAVRQLRAREWLFDGALHGANLVIANLKGADLRKADLRKADLRGADLRKADLFKASLSFTNLRQANLREADLRFADLGFADLRQAHLGGANLRIADLRQAHLGGANLRKADLREANVTPEQLDQAISLEGATMPDGSKHE